jgi:hypothetical protein
MKNFRIMLCLLFTTLSMIHAQPQTRSFTMGFNGGMAIPLYNESFRDYWRYAGSLGFEAQFFLSDHFSIAPRINYYNFRVNPDQLEESFGNDVSESGGTLSYQKSQRRFLIAGFNLQLFISRPSDIVGFYFAVGGSYCLILYESVEGLFEKDESQFTEILRDRETFQSGGANGGFGLEFWLHSRFCITTEVQLCCLLTNIPPRGATKGDIESIFLHDTKETGFISVLWGMRMIL